MKTRTEALKRAQQRYDKKTKVVTLRLLPEEIELVEAVRGDLSIGQFIKKAMLEKLDNCT